ncbi:MAG: hypothetical protein K9N06_00950 [Candidatus Cloacimonetes bacterium]|nr:hypothetical protein [Candidatus Cloacimonadota bacterium]
MKEKLQKIINILAADTAPKQLLIGFDGFIDEIMHVVNTRLNSSDYKKINTITEFAERIQSAAGLSANIELMPQNIKIGGNGVIMANSLAMYGMNIDYIGALGYPDINPLFSDFTRLCHRIVSVANPGHTQALEFADGKLMLGKIATVNNVTWDNLINVLGKQELEKMICSAQLIAFTNWTMLAGMDDIIRGFTNILKENAHYPLTFFDLADPAKRYKEDVFIALELIKELNTHTRVILGLNEKESQMIANWLGIPECITLERAAALQQFLDIDTILIHPLRGAAAANRKEMIWVDGHYTPTPVLTTGAGDNFNAGFCLGKLLGMTLEEALLTGVYTSGYYVRKAQSPTRSQMLDWLKDKCGE